jgi:uncharacterized protein (DUF58 family)
MAGIRLFKPSYFTPDYWKRWLRVASSHDNIATLNPRQIYILPTRWGILYAVMLILLLIGSINYSISLGYYVTFLLASLGNMAMLYTWRNLVHLQITTLPANTVFAGEALQMQIQAADTKHLARYAIAAQFEGNLVVSKDITANGNQTILVPLQTQQRGWHTLPRIKLHTEFPLMLFHAWAYVESPQQVLIYPKPSASSTAPPLSNIEQTGGKNYVARGDEDFDGHKTYQIGDAPSRVDWKASSKGVGMLSKQYSGDGSAILLLDWAQTSGLAFEARISQLTRWVIDAHAAAQHFGLKLPHLTLLPDNSEAHYHEALKALALLG